MKLSDLLPGMVLTRKRNWSYDMSYARDDYPEFTTTMYRVPDPVEFAVVPQSSWSSKGTMRAPKLRVCLLSPIPDSLDEVTGFRVEAVPHPNKPTAVVPCRELDFYADSMSQAMSRFATEHANRVAVDAHRTEVARRRKAVVAAAEQLAPGVHGGTTVVLPLELAEEIVAKAELYEATRED